MQERLRRSPQTVRLVHALLSGGQEWRHGYDLSKETGLKSGTLYPILIRLHDAGWLEAKWSEPEERGRPQRHLYRLTSEAIPLAALILSNTEPKAHVTSSTVFEGA